MKSARPLSTIFTRPLKRISDIVIVVSIVDTGGNNNLRGYYHDWWHSFSNVIMCMHDYHADNR